MTSTESLVLQMKPSVINKAFKVKDIDDVFTVQQQHDLQCLGAMERKNSEGFIRSVLMLWIAALNEYVYGNDREKALTEYQIKTVSGLLAEKYEVRNLNMADISLIFRQAYSGQFGKLYGRIRPDVIVTWFDQYFRNRCEAAALISQSKSDKINQLFHSTQRSGELASGMKEITTRIESDLRTKKMNDTGLIEKVDVPDRRK